VATITAIFILSSSSPKHLKLQPDLKEYTFAWLQKARERSPGDCPVHHSALHGPSLLKILLADALQLASGTPVLAGDQAERQPTEVPSIPHSGFPRTG
jgi:hypothetical protein